MIGCHRSLAAIAAEVLTEDDLRRVIAGAVERAAAGDSASRDWITKLVQQTSPAFDGEFQAMRDLPVPPRRRRLARENSIFCQTGRPVGVNDFPICF